MGITYLRHRLNPTHQTPNEGVHGVSNPTEQRDPIIGGGCGMAHIERHYSARLLRRGLLKLGVTGIGEIIRYGSCKMRRVRGYGR